MASTDDIPTQTEPSQLQNVPIFDSLAADIANVSLENGANPAQPTQSSQPSPPNPPPRPLIVYTRKQILHLSKSPLVKPPDGMPAFKVWFGELNEQALITSKKESEALVLNGTARSARYRRDTDDGDGPPRPPFRPTLSQPSQMGNFKHQPLRASDRERDRDAERDLRTLSDKYDRERGRVDRIGVPSHSTLLRNRDSAPHLPTGREGGAKKRPGESNEDWRRGAEPPRNTRDDHHTRRDRDDRERPGSRARDSSRQRDSPPLSRRERDERDRDRGDRRERDRDRDDHRTHDFTRRDRDRERFLDDDDPRRWRDDGKRDERLPQRRDKDRDRDRDRSRERGLEPDQDHGRDREGWSNTDDLRGPKRTRDRRVGGADARDKDKDDKRDRDKEKEPAWMETYVPPINGGGILGGRGPGEEVDSIQAWKKDMKERERKAKGLPAEKVESHSPSAPSSSEPPAKASTPGVEGTLNEIELFKLMMKQAKPEMVSEEGLVKSASTQSLENKESSKSKAQAQSADAMANVHAESAQPGKLPTSMKPSQTESPSSSPTSLSTGPQAPAPLRSTGNLGDAVSRVLSRGSVPELNLAGHDQQSSLVRDITTPTAPSIPFEPPRQSRLLAFGARASLSSAQPTKPTHPPDAIWPGQLPPVTPAFPNQLSQSGGANRLASSPLNSAEQFVHQRNSEIQGAIRTTAQETAASSGFVVYENSARANLHLESVRDTASFPAMEQSRTAQGPVVERNSIFASPTENFQLDTRGRIPTPPSALGYGSGPMSPFDTHPPSSASASAYSTGKGSRMAKHFERSRENQTRTHGAGPIPSGLSPRQDSPGYGPMNAGAGDSRNINDLLAMLTSSAQPQVQRGHQLLPSQNAINQNMANLLSQQRPQALHHAVSVPPNVGRHDTLLDFDDRFVSDSMVPGLRSVPVQRGRDGSNSGVFADDIAQLNPAARLSQQRNLEQMYGGPITPQYANQLAGNTRNMHVFQQQQPLRGGPSPIGNFNPAQAQAQQRLPPGLANLGGRPPHEPSQFMGNVGFGMPSQGLHGGMQQSNAPQPFNQFQNSGLGIIGNQPQLRGPPGGLGGLSNPIGNGLNGVSGLSGPAGVDFRGPGGPPQGQMIGVGGPGIGTGLRGSPGFNAQHMQGPTHVGAGGPSIGLRQQQQQQQQPLQQPQHLPPPHLMQQMLPTQMQQPHGLSGGVGQHSQNELMALLMGGHRE